MSSHHIIRENQEPAVLIMGFAPAETPMLSELLEWSPLVLVHENSLSDVLRFQIKFDVLLTSPDQINQLPKQVRDHMPLKVLSAGDSLFLLGLHYLVSRKCDAVNIITTEEILPLALQIVEQPAFGKLIVTFFSNGRQLVLVQTGTFKKWLPKQTFIGIDPLNESTIEMELPSPHVIEGPFELLLEQDGWFKVHATGPMLISL
jgi:hypothetical protein